VTFWEKQGVVWGGGGVELKWVLTPLYFSRAMHYVDVLNNQVNRCLIIGKGNVLVSTPKPPDHHSVSPIFPLNRYVRLSKRKNSVRCGQMTSYSCLEWSNDQLLVSGMVKWPAALVWYGQMTSCSCLVWSNDQLLLSGMVKWPATLVWYGQMTSCSCLVWSNDQLLLSGMVKW
jgi:hypothetical protein